jgi:hypothetical protein
MERATKPGWCCCCRRPDRPACGGRPQSKNCWNRRIHCQSVSLSYGSQSFRQTGRDPAGWSNPESQTGGSSNTGIGIVSWQKNCASSLLRSLAVVSAKVYFGIWQCFTKRGRNGVPRPFSPMDLSWSHRLFLKRSLPGCQARQEVEMDSSVQGKGCSPNDLTGRKTAWLLWYLPILLVIVGSSWNRGRVWLWVPAFVVMGAGCLANAAQCGRIHCYVTGPRSFSQRFSSPSGLGVVSLHPGLFLLVVFGACCLAMCAEIPLGRYRRG